MRFYGPRAVLRCNCQAVPTRNITVSVDEDTYWQSRICREAMHDRNAVR